MSIREGQCIRSTLVRILALLIDPAVSFGCTRVLLWLGIFTALCVRCYRPRTLSRTKKDVLRGRFRVLRQQQAQDTVADNEVASMLIEFESFSAIPFLD